MSDKKTTRVKMWRSTGTITQKDVLLPYNAVAGPCKGFELVEVDIHEPPQVREFVGFYAFFPKDYHSQSRRVFETESSAYTVYGHNRDIRRVRVRVEEIIEE